MKYTCLIAEDNKLERDNLELLLNKTGLVNVVAACEDGLEAYQQLAASSVDIVFSDIDMPNLNGFQLVKSLKNQPVFVFITAHSSYAAEGFELDVADFIVKPLTLNRLLRAINKAVTLVGLKAIAEKEPAPALTQLQDPGHIYIRTTEKLLRLDLDDLVYVETAGNFTKLFLTSGENQMILVSLKNLVAQLPPNQLLRTHRQYMVNPRHIRVIDQVSISLTHNYQVPLTAVFRQEILDAVAAKIISRNPDL